MDLIDLYLSYIHTYEMNCMFCNQPMIYTRNLEMERLGWISMDCPTNCHRDDGYLIPSNHPDLVKK